MLHRTYNSMMKYASHPKAVWWLNLVAFIESSVFLLPPDPLFIAMVLSNRENVWKYAFMCTVSSVLGGVLGYLIGYGFYETVGEWVIQTYGLADSFANFQAQFDKWGFWIIALKGLTPIPYKIVTISSGLVGFDFYKFILASIIARGFRFFTLGVLLWYYGPPIKTFIEKNLYFATTAGLLSIAVGFVIFKYAF